MPIPAPLIRSIAAICSKRRIRESHLVRRLAGVLTFLFAIALKLPAQDIVDGPQFDPQALSLGTQEHAPRALTVIDLVSRRHISGASLSPDGTSFSYVVVQASIQDNSYQTVLVLAESRTPSHTRMLGSAGRPRWDSVGQIVGENPRWSPDSRYLTYTIENGGVRQIGCWPVDGGPGEQLTHSELDILNYEWLPDGSGIVYGTRRERPNTADPPPNDPIRYQDATMGGYGLPLLDSNQTDHPEQKRFFYDFRHKTARSVTADEEQRLEGAVIPRSGSRQWKQNGLASPDRRLIVETKSVGESPEKLTSAFSRLLFREASSGKILMRSEDFKIAPRPAVWMPDNRILIVYWNPSFDTGGLYEVSVKDGKLRPVLQSQFGIIGGCSFTMKVDRALCNVEAPTTLGDLALVDLKSHTMKLLTDINPEFHSLPLGKSTPISWMNKYGDHRGGYVTLPVEYVEGQRYPAVIASYFCDLNGMDVFDEFPLQVLANKGFVVVCVNTPPERRRTLGFENALLDYASPIAAFEAILKILDKKGVIDTKRVGVTGLSYGAELAEYAISHSAAFAAAASSSAGAHDPETVLIFGKDAEDSYGSGIGLHPWWEGEEYANRWKRYSTLLNAEAIHSPWLIQVADRELVPAIPVFTRLETLKKPIELWVYPSEFHVKAQPLHQFQAQERYLDWFRFWLQDYEDPVAAKTEQYKRWDELRKLQRARKSNSVNPTADSQRPN
jgi:dipeptidyl aminopeptidase/acylaminoacyl peptidase